jgi:hypothetical protein
MAALVALGCDRLGSRETRPGALDLGLAVGAALLAVSAFAAAAALGTPEGRARWEGMLRAAVQRPDTSSSADRAVSPRFVAETLRQATGALGGAAFWLLCAAGALAARRARLLQPGPLATALAGVLAADLLVFASRFYVAHPSADLEWPEEFVRYVRDHPSAPVRLANIGGPAQDTSRARLAGVDHVGGNEVLLLRNYAELMATLHGWSPAKASAIILPARPHPVLEMMGARLWIVYPGLPPPPRSKAVGRIGPAVLYETSDALDRATIIPASRVIPSRQERLEYLCGEAFDPRREVVLEGGPPAPAGGPGKAIVLERSQGFYRIEADAPLGGYLLLSEAHYPGWSCTLGGRPAELLRANHFLQAVRLEPGRHVVEFRYRGTIVLWGLAILAVGGAAGGAWIAIDRRRRVRPPSPSPIAHQGA